MNATIVPANHAPNEMIRTLRSSSRCSTMVMRRSSLATPCTGSEPSVTDVVPRDARQLETSVCGGGGGGAAAGGGGGDCGVDGAGCSLVAFMNVSRVSDDAFRNSRIA